MARIKKVEIKRAEGKTAECIKFEGRTWEQADYIIKLIAQTAPEEGNGYDKCDFKVTWNDEDNTSWSGRLDITRNGLQGKTLKERIKYAAEWVYNDGSMPKEDYEYWMELLK